MVESEPDKGDFEPFEMRYGQLMQVIKYFILIYHRRLQSTT
jgi:hypothetical protein